MSIFYGWWQNRLSLCSSSVDINSRTTGGHCHCQWLTGGRLFTCAPYARMLSMKIGLGFTWSNLWKARVVRDSETRKKWRRLVYQLLHVLHTLQVTRIDVVAQLLVLKLRKATTTDRYRLCLTFPLTCTASISPHPSSHWLLRWLLPKGGKCGACNRRKGNQRKENQLWGNHKNVSIKRQVKTRKRNKVSFHLSTNFIEETRWRRWCLGDIFEQVTNFHITDDSQQLWPFQQ